MQRHHILIRIFSVFSLIVGLTIASDLIGSAPIMDTAIITGKNVSYGKTRSHIVSAQGRYEYNEEVGFNFFRNCDVGDTLKLELTPIFKEWRHAALVRHGVVIDQTIGNDIWYMAIFGAIFIAIVVVSCFAGSSVVGSPVLLILISFFNLLALVLSIRLFCLFIGVCEKI